MATDVYTLLVKHTKKFFICKVDNYNNGMHLLYRGEIFFHVLPVPFVIIAITQAQ